MAPVARRPALEYLLPLAYFQLHGKNHHTFPVILLVKQRETSVV